MQTKSRKFGVTNRILRLRFDFEGSKKEGKLSRQFKNGTQLATEREKRDSHANQIEKVWSNKPYPAAALRFRSECL
ncbi:hypothetical protein DEO72_LG9g3657 [Vigna unguiculata]|uniref:Uncharacterized protein n=1 Tax=Vigna unguiculata TaxID=3917 RepID=A0A4D6N5Q5_VIGUN|nr:hypothetical protein DEO72_LG9g3657 [Vigna unguiculata]